MTATTGDDMPPTQYTPPGEVKTPFHRIRANRATAGITPLLTAERSAEPKPESADHFVHREPPGAFQVKL